MVRRLKIEDVRKIAEERGGKLVSEKCVNTKSRLQWQCSKLHIWSGSLYSVEHGVWCGICKKEEE